MTKDEIIANLKSKGIVINDTTLPEIERLLVPYRAIGKAQSNEGACAILNRLFQAATNAGKCPRYARELTVYIPDDLEECRRLKREHSSDKGTQGRQAAKVEHLKQVHDGSDKCRAAAPALIERAQKLLHDDAVAKQAKALERRLGNEGIVTLAYSLLKRAVESAERKQPT